MTPLGFTGNSSVGHAPSERSRIVQPQRQDYFALIDHPEQAQGFFLDIVKANGAGARMDAMAFSRACRSVSAAVKRAGVGPGDLVLIFLGHGEMLLPAFFGVQRAGATPSFMPPLSPRQDADAYVASHLKLIAHTRPRLIIAEADVAERLGDSHGVPIIGPEALSAATPDEGPSPPVDLDAIALLQHSSGTTGLKKGVALSFRAILAQVESYGRALEIAGDETIVSWLPVYHDMGLIACTVTPFILRLPIVLMNPFEWMVQPLTLLEHAARASRPLIWLPNFAFNHLSRHARRLSKDADLSGVRAFISCSEPCKPASFDQFLAAFGGHGVRPEQLQTCYAMAENVFAVTQTRLGRVPARITIDNDLLQREHRAVQIEPGAGTSFLSCGRAVDGVEIEIRDETGPLADGQVGEICIAGASLYSGYFQQPDLTRERLKGGWHHTHDLGFRLGEDLYVCGRKDDLIIVAGRNLYAHDVEAVVSDLAGVKAGRISAFGVENPATGTENLIVLAETDPAAPATPDELAEAIRETLTSQIMVVPADILTLAPDTLIKTTSGKMSRDENKRRYLNGALAPWSGT